jgi:hypothetical protein
MIQVVTATGLLPWVVSGSQLAKEDVRDALD